MTNWLTNSKVIATKIGAEAQQIDALDAQRAGQAGAQQRRTDIAVIAWGTNMAPYSVLDRP